MRSNWSPYSLSCISYLDALCKVIDNLLHIQDLDGRQSVDRDFSALGLPDFQGLHAVAEQVEYLLVVYLVETYCYSAVLLPLLLIEDHLQRPRQNAPLGTAKRRLIEVKIRAILRAVSDDRICFSSSSLTTAISRCVLCENGRIDPFEDTFDCLVDLVKNLLLEILMLIGFGSALNKAEFHV